MYPKKNSYLDYTRNLYNSKKKNKTQLKTGKGTQQMLLQRRDMKGQRQSAGKQTKTRRDRTAHPPGQWGADLDPQTMQGQSRGCGPRGEQLDGSSNSYTVLPRPPQGTSAPERWETYAHTKRVRECSQQPRSYEPKSGNQLVKEETRCGLSTRGILLSHKRKSSHNVTRGTWKRHRTQTPSHVSPGSLAGVGGQAAPVELIHGSWSRPHGEDPTMALPHGNPTLLSCLL